LGLWRGELPQGTSLLKGGLLEGRVGQERFGKVLDGSSYLRGGKEGFFKNFFGT